VKIAVKDVEQFLKNIPKNIRSILFYGPDSGLVKARVDNLEKAYNLASKFKYEQIKSNPSLFLDSLRSISLFGEDSSKEKIAIIECSGATIVEPVLSVIKEGNYKGLVVFYAGELGPDSSLRRCFENNPNIAAIACYVEDQVGVARIIQQQLKAEQMTCENGFVQFLSNYIAIGNHALVMNEIEKIFLFLSDKKHVVIDDLKGFLQAQGEVTFDKLCYQASLRQECDQLLDKLQSEGHNLVSISRMLMRHFNRLYQVKLLIEQGKTEQAALDSLQPSVFFKQVNDFSKSLKLWTKKQLIEFLAQLNEIELLAKQNPSLANLMIRKYITNLPQ
jgi:DNA polymerase-3 subunit delta